jgi:Protein of unknown function (DUF2510)
MDPTDSVPAGWYADPQTPSVGATRWWDGANWTTFVSTDGKRTSSPFPSDSGGEPRAASAPTLIRPPDFRLRLISHIGEVLTVVLAVFTVTVGLIVLGSLMALTTLILETIIVVRRKRREGITFLAALGHLWIGVAGVIWFAFVWIHGIVVFLGR